MNAPDPGTTEPRGKKAAVVGAGGAAHFLHDGFSDTLYILFPLWAEAFGLTLAQVGTLKMVFSGALAGFQMPAGLLAERLGERRLLVIGTVVTAGGFMLFGMVGGFASLLVCLSLTGLGSSPQHPLASSIISRAYPDKGRRAALGAYNFLGDLGKVAVPAAVAGGIAFIGWRDSTLVAGGVGIGAALVLHILLNNLHLGDRPVRKRALDVAAAAPVTGWGIHDRRGFASLSGIGLIDTGARTAFLTFVPFLLIDRGASADTVGFALVLVLAGGAAGKLACGLVAERFGIIRTVVLTELATIAGMFALVYVPYSTALVLLPFVGLALNGTSSVLYGTIGDFVHAERQSRAFGLFYTVSIGGGAAAPIIYGAIGDVAGVPATMMIIAAMVGFTVLLCLPLSRSLAVVDAANAQAV